MGFLVVILILLLIFVFNQIKNRKTLAATRKKKANSTPKAMRKTHAATLKNNPKEQKAALQAVSPELMTDPSTLEDKLSPPPSTTSTQTDEKDYIALHLIADKAFPYAGYELFQSLMKNSFQATEQQVFHYFEKGGQHKDPLFTLVSANKPGTIDVSKIGAYSCPGLTLFMVPEQHENPAYILSIMHGVAQKLKEDLGGALFDDSRTLLTNDYIQAAIAALEEKVTQ
jgi:cell division protein ZipA